MPDPAGSSDPTLVGAVAAVVLSAGAALVGFLKALGRLLLRRLEQRWDLDEDHPDRKKKTRRGTRGREADR